MLFSLASFGNNTPSSSLLLTQCPTPDFTDPDLGRVQCASRWNNSLPALERLQAEGRVGRNFSHLPLIPKGDPEFPISLISHRPLFF